MTTEQLSKRLADRLAELDNPLAIVLSIHIFVEHLLNLLIEEKASDHAAAAAMLKDTRNFPVSSKLVVARMMGLIDEPLRANLDKLGSLRNAFAHRIDVDLSDRLFASKATEGFLDRTGKPAFEGSGLTKKSIQDDPTKGISALLLVRDVTFGWLYEVCTP